MTHGIVVFHFGSFLPFYPLNSPKKQNFKKMKKHREISFFDTCVPKIMIRWCTVPEIWWVTGGWTKKWHIEVGAPPKNFITLKYQVHDLLQKLHNIDFTWHRSQRFLRQGVEKQEFSAFPINFFENKQKLFSSNLIVYTPY